MSPYGTIYQGLRAYYHNYPRLEFGTIESFNESGGLDYVHDYYVERAARFNSSKSIPVEGMFALIQLAVEEDHYPTFNLLMMDFLKKGFIEAIGPRRAVGYAQFYMKNGGIRGAQSIYEILSKIHPSEPTPVNGLGHVFKALNNTPEAIAYYKKAIDLAKRGNHPRLSQFENDLIDIKNKK